MKIVIAGFGVEGQSNLRYFRDKFPEADFLVADEREKVDNLSEDVAYQTGFSGLDDADLIVRSPSLFYEPRQKSSNSSCRSECDSMRSWP